MRSLAIILVMCFLISCESKSDKMQKTIFLHHSTGLSIVRGKTNRYVYKLTNWGEAKSYIRKYNRSSKIKHRFTAREFPAREEYGWKNYPYDYYNIWVKNAGDKAFKNEPTLEMLTKDYDVIAFKHCFPVSKIMEDTGTPDINSEEKRLENYKLQYQALKEKMHEFPDTRFILWTPVISVERKLTAEQARRTLEFYNWIITEWNESGDNIYLWDFYKYATEGNLYLMDKYATSSTNSHPNKEFSSRLAPLFAQYVIDVAEGRMD